MRKNNSGRKQRIARAKRGLKKFMREKASRDEKHIRLERRLQQRLFRARKLDELIGKLSGESQIVQQETEKYMKSAEEKGSN